MPSRHRLPPHRVTGHSVWQRLGGSGPVLRWNGVLLWSADGSTMEPVPGPPVVTRLISVPIAGRAHPIGCGPHRASRSGARNGPRCSRPALAVLGLYGTDLRWVVSRFVGCGKNRRAVRVRR